MLRARAGSDDRVTEALLSRSTVTGPLVRVPTDRRPLLRALQLGFTEVQVAAADRPVCCRDGKRCYVWMPLDQASAYATIAAQGVHADPYLIARVETQQRDVVYRAHKKTERVLPADIMADTTFAMTKVLDCASGGTACGKALSGRPAAGKTGTNGQKTGNLDAWFAGFTPQLSTAVWYGNHERKKPVTHNGGPLYGGDLPAAAWQEMMNAALSGDPVLQFPPPAHVGRSQGIATPTSAPTTIAPSSPTPTPSATTVVPTTPPTTPPPILPSGSPSSSPQEGVSRARRTASPWDS